MGYDPLKRPEAAENPEGENLELTSLNRPAGVKMHSSWAKVAN